MLIQAIKAHSTPATLKALQAGANPNALDTEEPIYTWLAPYWKIFDIQPLIQSYGRVHQTALLLALEGDLKTQVTDENLFAFFKSNNVDPNLIQALLEYGANVNVKDKFGRTPLIAAFNPIPRQIFTLRGNFTFPSNEQCALPLIEAGTDVNAPDELGVTPLQYARRLEVRQALLRHGADVNGGVFPVLIAYAMGGDEEGCNFLFNHGANVNISVESGFTALTYAAQNGHEAVVNTLIARGANVNANVGHGRTPLMAAASGAHLSILKTLLAHGAEVNPVDEYKRTALDWAANDTQTVALLRKAGAKTGKELSSQSFTPPKH